ncbi:MAG: glycosyltransferase family 4 protein [Anaerolineales bacterium]
MRVGFLIYGSLDTLSGGYLYDRQLVHHLRALGDEVEIVSLPWRNYISHLTDNFSPSLRRHLLNGRWDVLLQDELNHPSLFLLNHWLRAQDRVRVRYPIVSIVHHLRCSELRPAWQNALYRLVERAYLRSVDGFVFNSDTTRREVEAVRGPLPIPPPGRRCFAYNGVAREGTDSSSPVARFSATGEGAGGWGPPFVVAHPAADHIQPSLTTAHIEARAALSEATPGPLRLLFLGNVIPRKGLHTLLAALARVQADAKYRGEWQLTVVGNLDVDPAYVRRIRQDLRGFRQSFALHNPEGLRLLGQLSDADVRSQLEIHDVLAVPSSYEGFGIVYLEAMAYGLPVIASTAGAAGEIITHGVDGYLVPPEDPTALADAIQPLLDDRGLLRRMSLAARTRYERHPSWAENMASVRQFLQAVGLDEV